MVVLDPSDAHDVSNGVSGARQQMEVATFDRSIAVEENFVSGGR